MKNNLIVKKSNSGFGLYSLAALKKGDLVIEYVGEKITEAEANRRGGKYLFELNHNWSIDGKSRDNLARYLNHSCKPNCYPEIDDAEEHIYIYAKKNIEPGVELTYHYGKMYFDELIKKSGCRCQACQKEKSG